MQNNHYLFSFLEISTFGEGGRVAPVGKKTQLLPKKMCEGFPSDKVLKKIVAFPQAILVQFPSQAFLLLVG